MEKKAFQIGWYKIPQGDVATVRIKLMAMFGITTRMAFLNRLNGKVNHTEEQIKMVEEIFHSYGITEIWGKV
jgi:predicted transglutaminase-like cysteine proteinase